MWWFPKESRTENEIIFRYTNIRKEYTNTFYFPCAEKNVLHLIFRFNNFEIIFLEREEFIYPFLYPTSCFLLNIFIFRRTSFARRITLILTKNCHSYRTISHRPYLVGFGSIYDSIRSTEAASEVAYISSWNKTVSWRPL